MSEAIFGENSPAVDTPNQDTSIVGQESATNNQQALTPNQNQGQPVIDNTNVSQQEMNDLSNSQEQPIFGENQDPAPTDQVQGQQDQGQGQDKILGKFNSMQDVANSLEGLANKLGDQVDWNKIQSDDDLLAAYQEAEKELGKYSDVDFLRKKARQQEAIINQMYMQMQQGQQLGHPMQQPSNSPMQQLGHPMQQPMANQAMDNQNLVQEGQSNPNMEIDPDEFIEQFYENPTEAISKITNQAVNQALEQEKARQQAEQQKRQQFEQQKQQVTQQLQAEVNRLKYKYGDQFEQNRQVAAQIMQQKPYYAQMPGGMELALQEAMQINSVQQPMQQQPQQPIQQNNQYQQSQQQQYKQGLRINGNNGNRPLQQQGQQLSPEEQFRKQIFGDSPSNGGIFDY